MFFGAQTTQKPKKYDRPDATANAAISARLPYIMATSRFAHYLKVMARDKIGSFMEAEDCEAWLNRWISNYVNSDADAGQEMKAKYPLREAKVEVEEIPGKPGSYNAVAYMRPWLQMEELTTSLRMVARIPAEDADRSDSPRHGQEADAPLRDIALTGRFLGGAAAERVSAFVASGDAAHHLTAWFGQEWLAALARQPGRVCLLRAALDRDIAIIDEIVSSQLDAVTQHPRYTRLEGSWRGIDWLVDRTPQAGEFRLRILHARWSEVCRDLERALEFDQSVLFRKIYEEEFGTPGGKPFGLIAADYQIRHRSTQDYPTDDVGALARFAGIAAAAFAPTIFAAAPELLGLDSFADVSASLDLSVVLRGGEYQRWRNIGNQDDLRFIGVALPRLLARPPWPDDGTRADRFRYRTHVPRAEQRVWTEPRLWLRGSGAAGVRAQFLAGRRPRCRYQRRGARRRARRTSRRALRLGRSRRGAPARAARTGSHR